MSENQILIKLFIRRLCSGKSTFLNAACLTDAKVSELPFTTIKPNKGVSYVKKKCVCRELNVEDDPQNSLCIEGNRFIPVNLLDVAGLVPDAHKGKGLGNQFLNDLSQADVLIHIVDMTGSLDKSGNKIGEGQNDPIEDIRFLEDEIDFWFKSIMEREDWGSFIREVKNKKQGFVDSIFNRLSGLKINKKQIVEGLKRTNLKNKEPSSWTDDDRLIFSRSLRSISKPIIIAANKIDKEVSLDNLSVLKEKFRGIVIPCCALAERVLKDYHERGVINYMSGSSNFKIMDEEKLTQREVKTLEKIRTNILKKFGGTGIQKVLNYAVFKILNQIAVYPVSDVNKFTDNKNRVLPDVFLVKEHTELRKFIREKIHSDLAEHFIHGIDAKTKRRMGESYKLKDNDIIKVVTSK